MGPQDLAPRISEKLVFRMKVKEGGGNMETALTQLQNLRMPESKAIQLLDEIRSCNNLNNVQRMKALKVAAHYCDKEGCSSDLRLEAMSTGLALVKADVRVSNSPASGAAFSFVEACFKILKKYAESSMCQHIDLVSKALDVLFIVNPATASKLFNDKGGISFKKIVIACLESKDLKKHTLALISMCLSNSESGLTEAIKENCVTIIQMLYPSLFSLDDPDLQDCSLKLLQRLIINKSDSWTNLPAWNKMKEDTQTTYYKAMISMVEKKQNWPDVWQFVVNMFGQELHSGGQLINHMLEVLERAFKHSDFQWTRVQAFACWETLIDNFKTGLRNKKRIDLIMIPLKANNHRIEALAYAKLKTYDHLLKTLGKELISAPDILLSFLSFCFGPEKSCFPVKFYPALDELCATSILDILSFSYIVEIFPKVSKELIGAVGDCFVMKNVSAEQLSKMWDKLLELVQKVEENCTGPYMMEIVKNLLIMINSLVAKAGGLTTDTNSPSRTLQSKSDLNQRLLLIVLPGIVHGNFALKSNLFKSRSLYIGSHDVMTSTPSLLVIEWLLTPGLLLSAGNSCKFMELILKMISLQREDISSFMDFVHSVLKKLLVMNDNVSLSKQPELMKIATDVWCSLAEEIVKFVQSEGSINQGNAAEHDFSALYAVLMFPSQNLFVDFQLISRCSEPWSSLFYEACQQAALIPTATEQYLCEQVCVRLVTLSKRSGGTKQLASVYYFLTLIVKVAKEKFNSVKRLRLVQSHVSVTVKELYSSAFDQEVVFNQVVSCVQQCLHPNTVSVDVIGNVSPTICALLQSRVTTYDPVDKLCNLLNAVKQASMYLNHHASSSVAVSSLLQGIIQAGKCHPCQKVRSTIRELCDASEDKRTSDKETKTSTVLSPSNRSPKTLISVSPKSASKKITAIQMSPSNLSPSNTKRKLQATVCGADGKFVRIETPPKKIILTEHQKEVRRERRQDIPALYQDLSQDTQSLSQDSSQDCVALPVTPSKKNKSAMPVDEDAVMDAVDAEASVQVVCSSFQSPSRTESPRSSSKFKPSLEPKSDARSFTPPAGFVLPSANDSTPRSENKDVTSKELPVSKQDSGKVKGPIDGPTSAKSDSANVTSRRGALTRSSSNTDLRTRSGKVLKRNSVVPEPDKVKKKHLPSRKSLPNNSSDDLLKKNMVETVVIESDNTDTESISSSTSDVSSSNARRPGTASRRRRSQKSLFQDLESEGASIVEMKDPITQNDNAEAPCSESPKLQKSVESKTLIAEQQINDKQNQPPIKKVGGKILTRSRSNSSLDEVIGLVKKQKESSAVDTSSKPGSPVESSAKVKDLNKVSLNISPRKKPTSFEVNSGVNGEKIDSLEISSAKKMNGGNLAVNASSSNEPMVENSSDFEQLDQSKSQLVSSVKSNESSKKEEVHSKSFSLHTGEKLRGKAQSSSSSGADVKGLDPEHGTEESQEIIESSQEPLVHLLKPCLVSLQQFNCSNVQQMTQIDDVIVEKGPDDKSPYKVRSKEVQVSPTSSSSTRRALDLDADKTSSSGGNMRTVILARASSPVKSNKGSAPPVLDEVQPLSADVLGETANDKSSGNDSLKIIPTNMPKETETAPTNNKEAKNDSKPDWMHAKKNSSPNKVLPKMGSTSARRHAFMKSVRDCETSSSPPKGVDISPMSSPVQSKRISKSVESGNVTPIINRASRAAQILGLGQAAAARGGDKVVASASRSGEVADDNETAASRAESVTSSSTEVSSMSTVITSSSVFNPSNTIVNSILPSPSVRRQSKIHDLDSQKSTPQKCLEDGGLKEDWVPRTPCPTTATPDSSILKRKRENDMDTLSPSVKRKRVSFRDPPLTSMLRFGESVDVPGTVFSSDQSNGTDKFAETSSGNHEKLDDGRISWNGECANGREVHCQGAAEVMDCSSNAPPQELRSIVSQISSTAGKTSKEPSKTDDKAMHHKFGESNTASKTNDPHLRKNFESMGSPDLDTQGMLDDLHQMPSSSSSVYPTLIWCKHPITAIVAKLTSPVWEKTLTQELSSHGVSTIGDLAKLTEDKIDRLSFKAPKKTNVYATLEDFESRHSSLKDSSLCGLKEVQSNTSSGLHRTSVDLVDVLTNANVEDILKILAQLGRGAEVAAAVTSNETIVKALPLNSVVNSNDPQQVAAVVSSNEKILKCIPVDAVINCNDPKAVAKVVTSNSNILQSLPMDVTINSFLPQNVAEFVTSNSHILKSIPLDVAINSSKPGDVAAIVSTNPKILGHIPVDVVINNYQPQNVAETVSSNKKILKSLPLDAVVKSNNPNDVASIVSANLQILKHISPELVINCCEPKDIAKIVSSNSKVLKALPLDAILSSNQVQDVATILSENRQILESLPVDIVADVYISRARCSSGSREGKMTAQELRWILLNIPKDVILETICPSVPNNIFSGMKDTLRDHVLKQCTVSEIVKYLDFDKADKILKALLLKAEPETIAGHFDPVRSKETIEALLSKFNPKECMNFLLSFAMQLNSSL